MSNIFYLDLPDLPESIASRLIAGCKTIKISQDRLDRCRQRFEFHAPVAVQEYGNENSQLPRDIIDELSALYGKFFKGGVMSIYGLAKNVADAPSLTPPHTDRGRRVAINYLLQTGGANVVTSFYTERNPEDADLSASLHRSYDQVVVESQVVVQAHRWHCFNPQQFHSVENIETERYYLSLSLYHNNSYEDFVEQYSHLLIRS
jgi:hypothetical protein